MGSDRNAEWLERHRRYLGASDAPAVLGLSRWKSRADVCREKWGEGDEDDSSPVLERGLLLEEPIRCAYSERTGAEVTGEKWMVHPDHEWMAASPDGLVKGRPAHLEIKTHIPWLADEYGEEGSADIPVWELAQVVHQLAVTGHDEADLAVLFAPEPLFGLMAELVRSGYQPAFLADYILHHADFRIYKIRRDMELEEGFIEAERKFWTDFVVPHVLPPEDESVLDDGNIRQATPDEATMISLYRNHWVHMKREEEALNELKAKIIIDIGSSRGIESEAGKITYKKPASGAVSWKKVAEEIAAAAGLDDGALSEIVEKHTSEPKRRFLVPSRAWKKEL